MPKLTNNPNKNYLLYRLYCFLVVIIFAAVEVMTILTEFKNKLLTFTFIILIPLFFIAVLMVTSTMAFPIDYSKLGKYRRREFPRQRVLYEKNASYGNIGRYFSTGFPLIKWKIFSSGLGISILGIGNVFIPKEDILKIYKIKFAQWSCFPYNILNHFYFVLEHKCPEARNPIYAPSHLFEIFRDNFNISNR